MRRHAEAKTFAQQFLAVMMSTVLILATCMLPGCGMTEEQADDAAASGDEVVEAETDETDIDELLAGYESADDPEYLRLASNYIELGVGEELSGTSYSVADVQAVYVSKEYLEEVAYNSKSNVFFGYELDDLADVFEGKSYVFDVGDDGETTVHEFEPYEDEFAEMAKQIVTNAAIAGGVILAQVTIAASIPATAPVWLTALVAIPAGTSIGEFTAGLAASALSFGVIDGVISGVTTGAQTGSVSEALESAAIGTSEGLKWGAVFSATVDTFIVNPIFHALKAATTATAKTVEIAGTTLSKEALEKGIADETYNLVELQCRNAALAGAKHATTGVEYVERWILQADGKTVVKGVFPKFDSTFTTKLAKEFYTSTDYASICTKELAEAVEKDASLAAKFTEDQLKMIESGKTPTGYVWHHNEEEGVMQLVDATTHRASGHTGGSTIWGPDSVA